MRSLKVNYPFAYGGIINHTVYFDNIGDEGGAPTGAVGDLLKDAFGSYKHWVADWTATGIAGRGWAYLG